MILTYRATDNLAKKKKKENVMSLTRHRTMGMRLRSFGRTGTRFAKGGLDVACVNNMEKMRWVPWTKIVQKSKYNKTKLRTSERLLVFPGRLKWHFVEFREAL